MGPLSHVGVTLVLLFQLFVPVHLLTFSWSQVFSESCSLHLVGSLEDKDIHNLLGEERNRIVVFQIDNLGNFSQVGVLQRPPKSRKLLSDPCFAVVPILSAVGIIRVPFWMDLLNYMQSLDFLVENPNYVLLQLPYFKTGEMVPKFLATLKLIHTTSKYIVVSQDGRLHIACLHCHYSSNEKKLGLEFEIHHSATARREIDRVWRRLHGRINGTRVQLLRDFLLHPSNKTVCKNLTDFRGVDSRHCIVELLSQVLDFRVVVNIDRETKVAAERFGNLIDDPTASDEVISNEIDHWQATDAFNVYSDLEQERMSYVPQGWLTDPLSFIIVLDKWSLGQSALLQPYDKTTWILILISMTLVSIVLAFTLIVNRLSVKVHRKIWRKCLIEGANLSIQLSLMVLGAIIEQNPKERTCKKVITSFRVLFGVWLLTALVISNGYTGIVISFMCTTLLPKNLPQDIKGLLDSPFQLVSVDELYVSITRSMMHFSEALIIQYHFGTSTSPDYQEHYFKVHNRTKYLSKFDQAKLAFLHESETSLPGEVVRVGFRFKWPHNRWELGKNYVYISRESATIRFANLIKTSCPECLVHIPRENNEILSIQATYASVRNYFSVFVQRYIHFMVEAGLPLLWERKEQEDDRYLDSEMLDCWKEWNLGPIWEGPRECHHNKNDTTTTTTTTGAGVSSRGHLTLHHVDDDQKKPLNWMNLVWSFHLLWCGVGLAGIFLLIELVVKICRPDEGFEDKFMQTGLSSVVLVSKIR